MFKHVIKNNQYSYQYIKQNKDYEIKKKKEPEL